MNQPYDDSIIEHAAVQTVLLRLMPMLCLLSMANILDRMNLAYAAPDMDPSLHLTAAQLHLASDVFFAGYLAAGIPSALALRRLDPRRWLTAIVLAWGTAAVANAFVWNAITLYGIQFLLGAAEAGLMPAILVYLMPWLPARHRGKAIAILLAAGTIMPLAAAPVSQLILLAGRFFGIADWRWLFLVEGLPVVALGLHISLELPRDLAEPRWLTPAQRHWLLTESRRAAAVRRTTRFAEGLQSRPVWRLAALCCATGTAAAVLVVWLPETVRDIDLLPRDSGGALAALATVLGTGGVLAAGMGASGMAALLPEETWMATAGQTALRWWTARMGRPPSWLTAAAAVLGVLLLGAEAGTGTSAGAAALFCAACIVPGILALAWIAAPRFVAGDAAAAGFTLLNMAVAGGALLGSRLDRLTGSAASSMLVVALACVAAAGLVVRLGRAPTAALPASATPAGD